MAADTVWPKIPQMPQNLTSLASLFTRIYMPNLSAQAQKFWISMKKGFIGHPQSVVVVNELLIRWSFVEKFVTFSAAFQTECLFIASISIIDL